MHAPRFVVLLALSLVLALPVALLAHGAAAFEPPTSADPGWPRTFSKDGASITLHQPQVDSWKDHETIAFRCAVEVTLKDSKEPAWGVVAVQGATEVDEGKTDVSITGMKVTAVRFPGATEANATAMQAAVMDLLPNKPVLHVALQRVLAYMHDQPKPVGVPLNLQPPPIYYSSGPASLLIFMGQPIFQAIPSTTLSWAVNTNWNVLLDNTTKQYYLLVGSSWMTAPDALKGPWTATTQLPAEFFMLPQDAHWADVLKNVPGQPMAGPMSIIATTEPAELIATDGQPSFTPIEGTSLMYVSNPEMPVFLDAPTSTYYYLVSGRWFSAPTISGPWSAASASLPADFAKIPPFSTMGFVLSSVPGTIEANDAILIAQVPHKATVDIAKTTVEVTYQGSPSFVPIQGTTMQYATNTSYQVIDVSGKFYCCSKGVWFVAPAATGPWAVCTSVPAVIYTIPPSSPVYNCTYVYVYGATPTTVTVGYTSGYSGAYVGTTGALMFGAGVAVGAVIANNSSCCWYGYHPAYYSYGCAPYYHYGACGYYSAGYAHYGPYGGAGYHAGYNASTGTYYRGGAEYGGGQAHWGGEAYNPWTGSAGAHTGGTTGYKSWGSSYVQNGSSWAQAGHESTARGTAGYAENSSGQWAEGAHSSATNSTVARTSSGAYAGHDGNVYKNTGSGWEKYDDGSWSSVQKPSTTASENAGTRSENASTRSENASTTRSNASSEASGARASGGGGGGWSSHESASSLNKDSWSRNFGNGGSSSWGGGDRASGADRSSSGQRSGGFGSSGGSHSWGGGSSHSFGGFGGGGGGGGGHSFGGFGGGGRSGGFHGGGFRR